MVEPGSWSRVGAAAGSLLEEAVVWWGERGVALEQLRTRCRGYFAGIGRNWTRNKGWATNPLCHLFRLSGWTGFFPVTARVGGIMGGVFMGRAIGACQAMLGCWRLNETSNVNQNGRDDEEEGGGRGGGEEEETKTGLDEEGRGRG